MTDTTGKHYSYMSGFGNEFQSEALPGSLPKGQNNPRICPYGLYAEQISGTAFTAPRRQNQRTWLYRCLPSVVHKPFEPFAGQVHITSDPSKCLVTPKQLRWKASPMPRSPTNFIYGLQTMCCAGNPSMKDGYAIHVYAISASMQESCLCNADGDFLFVPQYGMGLPLSSPGVTTLPHDTRTSFCVLTGRTVSSLVSQYPAGQVSHLRAGETVIRTEMGSMHVSPGEIAVVQRGMRFAVDLAASDAAGACARGYVLEVYSGHFQLPDLGPIGANGLANARDFLVPEAAYERRQCTFQVFQKLSGRIFVCEQDHSPFDVVAWHGNYVPYKYDLSRFCPAGFVGFDHADPSIFTVLTCPSALPGIAAADFVVFPARWIVAENTFRPPYFHRNTMSEFMGLVRGTYDGKRDGFEPGGSSLHTCMAPHGPDQKTFEEAVDEAKASKPQEIVETLAFMFEVSAIPHVTKHALELPSRDLQYNSCWQDLQCHFSGAPMGVHTTDGSKLQSTKS